MALSSKKTQTTSISIQKQLHKIDKPVQKLICLPLKNIIEKAFSPFFLDYTKKQFTLFVCLASSESYLQSSKVHLHLLQQVTNLS